MIKQSKRSGKFAAAITFALLMQGCSLFEDEEVVVPPPPPPTVTSGFTQAPAWSVAVGNGVGTFYSQLQPAVSDGKLFAAARNGVVSGFDAESGKQLWSVDLSSRDENQGKRSARISGGIVSAFGNLYLGSENGYVYALNSENGEIVWSANVGGEVVASPSVGEGKVIAITTSGKLVALDALSGELVWDMAEEQPVLTLRSSSKPVIANGGVIYGRADGKVGLVLVENGQPVRQSKIADPRGATEIDRIVDVDATPLIIDDELYAIAFNGQLMARKLISGDEVWKRKYSAWRDMTASEGVIFISDSRSHLFAVDRSNGLELWSNTELERRDITAPTVFGDYLVVGDFEGYLYWLDRITGQLKSVQRLDESGFYTAAIVEGDKLYIQSRDGKIYTLTQP